MEIDQIDGLLFSYIKWSRIWTVLDIFGLIIILLFQGFFLNYYITLYNNKSSGWYFLFLIDFFVLFLFIFSIFFCKKHYKEYERNKKKKNLPQVQTLLFNFEFSPIFGALPLIYISWFIYGMVLLVKTFIIFLSDIPEQMIEKKSSKNLELLEICLAAIALVFLLWVEVHKNIIVDVSKKWIKAISADLISHTVFELFDSIFFLDLIMPNSTDKVDENFIKITSPMKDTIICLASLNFIYPTLSLFKYSRLKLIEEQNQNQDYESQTLGLNIIIHLVRIIMINIPYLLIRIHLSSSFNKELSIFILKNILGLIISIRSLTIEIIHWFKYLKAQKMTLNSTLQVATNETSERINLQIKESE